MKITLFLSISVLSGLLISCQNRQYLHTSSTPVHTAPSPQYQYQSQTQPIYTSNTSDDAKSILASAYKYRGTPYKFGGESHSGIDCSGLVLVAFSENGINLPRTSADQATKGSSISLNSAQPGDLIFFDTDASGRINHVGIVTAATNGSDLEFIHSSSSKGVKISSLSSEYWAERLVSARRILN